MNGHWSRGFFGAVAILAVTLARGETKFEITFSPAAHAGPITGRVFVAVSKQDKPEPMHQVGTWLAQTPLFGADVEQLAPGSVAVIDSSATGFPVNSLKDVPAGDYYVQAVINVYTQFHRSDGHVIWAHMDQWEGQHVPNSPGSLISTVRRVHLDPAAGYNVKLELTQVIPPVQVPQDTAWVKSVKIQSKLLTKFWGHPIYLGAMLLLPKGYDEHPNARYPGLYIQNHFSLKPPLAFTEKPGPGSQFYQQWTADDFPRMIAVTFQHPTQYFDDSYAVNSANTGPYGDALLQELIPYLEEHFRLIRSSHARVLTGGSTGGWESLALQIYHPDFFGGAWATSPDPVDFHCYQMVNIYEDSNAFQLPGYEFNIPERPMMRAPSGQVIVTVRQMSQFEATLGSKGRSTQPYEAWEAVYGPVGEDGYPRPLWDKKTGKIDHEVALYMRDHGYDLNYYLQQNWAKLGPQLKDKIRIYMGDMDDYYLNLAAYRFEDFFKKTQNPHDEGHFEYGRPMKGHGWSPLSAVDKIRSMADHIARNAPAGEDSASWHYK